MKKITRMGAVATLAALSLTTVSSTAAGAATVEEPPRAATTEKVSFRLGTLNLPGHTDGPKAHLLKHPQRTRAALEHLEERNISLVSLQELSTYSRTVIGDDKEWGLASAAPNDVFGDNRVGNAVAYRRDIWKVRDNRDLKIAMPGRPRGINMAVVTLEHRASGATTAVIAVHHPSPAFEASAARTAASASSREITAAKELLGRKIPVVIAGDMNDVNAYKSFTSRGFKSGSRSGVDQIVGAGLDFSAATSDSADVQGVFTDHPLVHGRVTLTIPAETAESERVSD